MQNNNALVDSDQVNNLKQVFNEGFREFLDTYFKDFELKEKEISGAISQKKIDNVIKISHSLKGSSLNMGAIGLANACYQIEMASKRGNIDEITREYNELKRLYPKTKEVFLQICS